MTNAMMDTITTRISLVVLLLVLLLTSACGEDTGDSELIDADATGDQTELDTDTGDVTGELDSSADLDQEDTDTTDEPDPTEWAFEPDHVLQVDIQLPTGSWDYIRQEGRTLFDIFGPGCLDEPFESPFTWLPGDVEIDGELVENVAIRKKGFLGSLSTTKPSLKLKFDKYVPGREYRGLERMTFNNARQDPSYLNQCLTYQLFRQAGLAAPRCNFAALSLNGEPLGLYVHVDPIKKRFLRRYFNDDEGKLYEGTLSDFRDGWTYTFAKKTNDEEPDDRAEIAAAVAALDAPDDQLEEVLDSSFNLDQFFRFWAMEVLVAHWDGYAGNTNNFYIYADPDDEQRFHFIPWGADATFLSSRVRFEQSALESVMATGKLARRLYLHPQLQDRYVAALQEHLDTVWDEDELLSEVDRMETLITPYLSPDELPAVQTAIEDKRDFINNRRSELEAELNPEPPAWEAPLRDELCADVVGSVSGTFDTTWGTHPVEDIFSTGTGTLMGTIDGNTPTFNPVGAKAGIEMAGANQGRATITLAGVIPNGPVLVLTFSTEEENIAPGTLALDWTEVEANALLFLPAEMRIVPFGFMFSGTLELTEASTEDGAPVRGSFSGDIFQL